MNRTIYISGPITGHPDYQEKFALAEAALKAKGWTVINPANLPKGLDRNAYLPICLDMLDAADSVCMLDGWNKSGGAKIERAYASYQRKAVYNHLENVPKIE